MFIVNVVVMDEMTGLCGTDSIEFKTLGVAEAYAQIAATGGKLVSVEEK